MGKWDETWTVQLTVSEGTNSTTVAVVYEWEERVGKPMMRDRFLARLVGSSWVDNDAVMIMSLVGGNPPSAILTGNFKKCRVARLKKVKTPECFECT